MKKALWKFGYEDSYLLIDVEKIENRALINESVYTINKIPFSAEELNQKLKMYQEKNDDFDGDEDDLEQFFDWLGYDAEIDTPEEYPEIEDQVAFDYDDKVFFNFKDCETIKVYEWWDGSNWKTVALWGDAVETIVELKKDAIDLDVWNGHDRTTGGTGLHQSIYPIITIDDEPVEETFLLMFESQWQGAHTTGKILSFEEVKEHLEELGRDVGKYLYHLGKIVGE